MGNEFKLEIWLVTQQLFKKSEFSKLITRQKSLMGGVVRLGGGRGGRGGGGGGLKKFVIYASNWSPFVIFDVWNDTENFLTIE